MNDDENVWVMFSGYLLKDVAMYYVYCIYRHTIGRRSQMSSLINVCMIKMFGCIANMISIV